MTQQASVLRGNVQQKVSSAGFIIGAVMILIGNIWVTMVGLGNPTEALGTFSENVHLLQIVALLITFGWWAVLIGVVGVYQSISTSGATWARLAMVFMILGSTLWTLGMALDISYSNLIANWLSAPDSSKEFARNLITIYSPTLGIGRGLFPVNVMSNWLAFGFLGIGMIRSSIYPRWLARAGLVLGFIGLTVGATMVFIGREAIWVYFTVLAFVSLLWLLSLGTWMAKEAWSKPSSREESRASSFS
jgi:hypothetical protein